MKRFIPHISSVVLVTVGVLIGSTLTGNNAIAQKLAAITGSGIQDHLAKWINNTGGLGNSGISEDKQGNLTIGGSIKFPDGSVQSSASTGGTGTSLASHHQELTLVGQPSEQVSFELPRKDFPVQIDISTSVIVEQLPICNSPNTTTLTSPPVTVSMLIALDSSTGKITNPTVASSRLNGDGFWAAILTSDPLTGRIVISPSRCAPSVPLCNCFVTPDFVISGPITYHVSMWY